MMMSADDLRACLSKLGLRQVATASLLGKNDRTVRRWLVDGIQNDPTSVILLRLMEGGKVKISDVERIKAEEAAR